MKRFREDHPTYKKLEEVFSLMEKLKISISIPYENAIGFPFLEDEETALVGRVSIVDLETGIGVTEFPPQTEYKLIWDENEPEKYRVNVEKLKNRKAK